MLHACVVVQGVESFSTTRQLMDAVTGSEQKDGFGTRQLTSVSFVQNAGVFGASENVGWHLSARFTISESVQLAFRVGAPFSRGGFGAWTELGVESDRIWISVCVWIGRPIVGRRTGEVGRGGTRCVDIIYTCCVSIVSCSHARQPHQGPVKPGRDVGQCLLCRLSVSYGLLPFRLRVMHQRE